MIFGFVAFDKWLYKLLECRFLGKPRLKRSVPKENAEMRRRPSQNAGALFCMGGSGSMQGRKRIRPGAGSFLAVLEAAAAACGYSIRPYFSLIRSSFSNMGSAAIQRKNTVATAWMQSMGKPVT